MCGSIPPPIMFLLSTLMVKFVSFYCDIDTGAQMFALIQLWSIIQIMAINRRDILSILYFREDSRKRPERKRPFSIVFSLGKYTYADRLAQGYITTIRICMFFMHDLKNIIIQDENQHSCIELKIKANVRLRCKGISISVFCYN